MFHTCCVLIKLSLILCVVGAINIDNANKSETERKFADLEAIIVQKINKLESHTLDRIITYIDRKFDESNKKIEDNFENKITQAMTASNKKGEENLFNVTQALNVFNKKIEENVLNTTQTCISLNKKTEDNLEKKIAQISNALDSMKEDHKKCRTSQLPCKEESFSLSSSDRFTPYYSVYNESLQHVTVQRDSAGRLTHFELHVALQADRNVLIRLSDKDYSAICEIWVGRDRNQYTYLNANEPTWSTVQRTHTPDILSSTQFRSFYIKVDDGTVQFGKEGDSTPLVSHYDADLGSLEYFRFSYHGDNTSKIRYDCPHVPESS